MVNHDFLQIKSLEGELKISHKKKNFGITVSTKELVYQKPHVNYIVRLEDIVSIVPYEEPPLSAIRFVARRHQSREISSVSAGEDRYRIYVKSVAMHNRSGIFRLGPTEFILPVLSDLLRTIGRHAQLDTF